MIPTGLTTLAALMALFWTLKCVPRLAAVALYASTLALSEAYLRRRGVLEALNVFAHARILLLVTFVAVVGTLRYAPFSESGASGALLFLTALVAVSYELKWRSGLASFALVFAALVSHWHYVVAGDEYTVAALVALGVHLALHQAERNGLVRLAYLRETQARAKSD